jgi:hypothetical protein
MLKGPPCWVFIGSKCDISRGLTVSHDRFSVVISNGLILNRMVSYFSVVMLWTTWFVKTSAAMKYKLCADSLQALYVSDSEPQSLVVALSSRTINFHLLQTNREKTGREEVDCTKTSTFLHLDPEMVGTFTLKTTLKTLKLNPHSDIDCGL